MPAKPDKDEQLLSWVYRCSLTTAETDARRLRRKNAKARRLAIEQSEHEAAEAAVKASQVAKLKWQHDWVVWWMKMLIVVSNSLEDGDDRHGSYSDKSDDPPPTADTYSYACDQKSWCQDSRRSLSLTLTLVTCL